jgi:hypothetical protein
MKPTQEVLDWLLERENPAVRLGTLRNLCGLGENDPELLETRQAMMAGEQVQKILSKQTAGGYWGKPEDFYIRSKYKGTVWNVILLAEMGADGSDEQIKKACDFLLDWSQDAESGGFAFYDSKRDARREQIGPCLTGNLVWSMLRFGLVDDPRVWKGVEWIAKYQRADDGTKPPGEWPYAKYEACWGRHTCMMGVVKGLKALAEVPPAKRTAKMNVKIGELVEFLLQHHLFKRSHNPEVVANERWTRFGFPRFWATDALEMLAILVKLGYRDVRMQDAIDLVLSKQGEDGRWKQEDVNFNGRTLVQFEKKGEASKWVTLDVIKVLNQSI